MNLLKLVLRLPTQFTLSAQTFFSVFIAVCLAALEIIGRRLTTDLEDASAALGLFCLIALVASWHRRRPLNWVFWLGNVGHRLGTLVQKWRYEHGIDFRGAPPIPQRMPGIGKAALALMLIWTITAILVWRFSPSGWRTLGLHSSYLVYLIGMTLLWITLLVTLFLGLYLPLEFLNRKLKSTLGDPDRRAVMVALALCYAMIVLTTAAMIPLLAVIGLTTTTLLILCILMSLPSSSRVAFLWRTSRYGPLFSYPLQKTIAAMLAVTVWLGLNLILSSAGGHLVSPVQPGESLAITASLGTLVAWTIPGLLTLLALRLWSGFWADPARRSPPQVALSFSPLFQSTSEPVRTVQRQIRNWGWRLRSSPGGIGELKLVVVPQAESEATEFFPVWPLKICAEDLQNPDVQERLRRRHELMLRHRFKKRFKQMMTRLLRKHRRNPGGYWFAPHWWFIESMGREEKRTRRRRSQGEDTGDLMEHIRPSYDKLFGTRVRQYAHEVLSAVQVDVIYIQDGVKLRSMMHVMENLFEVYDRSGGNQAVEDHHFLGIPGVRTMILDMSPQTPLEQHAYQETRFDELNRGRVMHIFRDRGEEDSREDVPFDQSWEPAPLMRG